MFFDLFSNQKGAKPKREREPGQGSSSIDGTDVVVACTLR
jgi:hypothetical protein